MNVTEDASAVVALAISAMEDAVQVTAKHTQQLKQAMDDAIEVRTGCSSCHCLCL